MILGFRTRQPNFFVRMRVEWSGTGAKGYLFGSVPEVALGTGKSLNA